MTTEKTLINNLFERPIDMNSIKYINEIDFEEIHKISIASFSKSIEISSKHSVLRFSKNIIFSEIKNPKIRFPIINLLLKKINNIDSKAFSELISEILDYKFMQKEISLKIPKNEFIQQIDQKDILNTFDQFFLIKHYNNRILYCLLELIDEIEDPSDLIIELSKRADKLDKSIITEILMKVKQKN